MENKKGDEQSLSDPQTLQQVKNVISSFSLALKNLSLYPEGHEISVSSVSNLENLLSVFLKKHKVLKIYVKNDRLLFEKDVAHSGEANETNPAFILFRDGIQQIEFSMGITRDELDGIIRLINNYTVSQEEPEGDLVTALWDMALSHFDYIATDMLWEAEPLYDVFLERQGEAEGLRLDEEDTANGNNSNQASENHNNPLLNVSLNIIDVNDWRLTGKEKRDLQERVVAEVQKDAEEDIFDVLLYILQKQDNENDFSNILEFMKEELKKSLTKHEFNETLTFLTNLGKARSKLEEVYPWSPALIDKFHHDISSFQFLNILEILWPKLSMKDIRLHEALKQVLMLLKPDCILTLLPMLSKISSDPIRFVYIDVISQHASSDISHLEQLLSSPQTAVIRNIIFILNRLEGDAPVKLLLKVLRHPSEFVRKDALKALIKRDFENVKDLFILIDDPDSEIRQIFLKFLCRQRSHNSEKIILSYLRKLEYKGDDNKYILDCYEALGKCGSDFSISYLQDTLFKEKLNILPVRALHRQGACIALNGLSIEAADGVLKKASKSMMPVIRKAYKSIKVINHE